MLYAALGKKLLYFCIRPITTLGVMEGKLPEDLVFVVDRYRVSQEKKSIKTKTLLSFVFLFEICDFIHTFV